jgi:hypothetical protein
LFVVEGTSGSAGSLPGTLLFPSDPTQRPDLQILASRGLGLNPTTEVCDVGVSGGGVPGFDPPIIGPGQDITDALTDLACRFEVNSSSSNACTVDQFGLFSFVSAQTLRQYCFQVTRSVAFPTGDTIVALQLRDSQGRLGPKREIVIRVLGQ